MNAEIQVGERLMITSGDYSDYAIQCFATCTKNFIFSEALKAYLGEQEKRLIVYSGYSRFNRSAFILWMQTQGYIQEDEIRPRELNLGYHSAECRDCGAPRKAK